MSMCFVKQGLCVSYQLSAISYPLSKKDLPADPTLGGAVKENRAFPVGQILHPS